MASRTAPERVELLALDLDGTLLRRDNTIGARTREALKAAAAAGVKLVLNSGRMTPAMEHAAKLLDGDAYLIAYNGAAASDLRANGRRRLFERTMPLDVARELVAFAKRRRVQLNYYLDEFVYCEPDPALRRWVEFYQKRTGSPYRFVERMEDHWDRAPYKVLFIAEPAVREALMAELEPQYAKRATVTRTDPEYLEFLHPEVNKGAGLRGLAESLGVPMARTLAVGDSYNDAPMLAAAGWGVAVANAAEPVRAAADAVTAADCEHDAVAEAVERWVLR
ncbi:MAG: Cof-type HAD-IIB family hydrolase [Planctomycetota bacterium]|nr:Cof-type HAD-IIB family hydrolase [Planctomycetota bacterium]